MTSEKFKIIKNSNTLLLIYKFGAFIFLCYYVEAYFLRLNHNYIIIKNAKGDPKTIAKIITKNRIDYTPKVSVIIPTYNSEEFLVNCLETVINQTLKEIEIICVDDGSIDNTLYILKNYAKKDERITILKQKNLNVGFARNAGLTVAKGKYLSFLDSDNFFDLNMLEEMYEKIIKEKSDIIICQNKTFDNDNGLLDEESLSYNLKFDLISNINRFSVHEISNSIFQLFEGWAWDKLFRTDFILSNNIKFPNIINFNDNQFTYTALCKAKSITTLQKKFVTKMNGHQKSLSLNKKHIFNFVLEFDIIKYNLKKLNLYHLVKKSFWKWVVQFCITQLKNIDKDSKEYLYKILNKKFNYWNYVFNSSPSDNNYIALNYIKHHKFFPTINIVYLTNYKNFIFCLTSIISILKNSQYENINFILLCNNISYDDLQEINKLKKIRSFSLHILFIPNVHYKEFQIKNNRTKTILFSINILTYLVNNFSNIDKALYLSCNNIIKKSLLYFWEIKLNNKLISVIKDISFNKDKGDIFENNGGILLLNIEEGNKEKLLKKVNCSFEYIKQIIQFNPKIQNKFIDNKIYKLNIEYYLNEINLNNNNFLYLDNEKNRSNFRYWKNYFKEHIYNKPFIEEFFKYYSILNNINNVTLTIPIVLASDDKYLPFMYTTMISILENGNKNTYYIFYLLVPFNFSQINKTKINEINNNYKCFIYFIHIPNIFDNIIMKIPHITLTTYFRLLIGDYLPKKIEKCIYLDVDIIVTKDLSELFLIEMKDNYLAGVVAAGYYFKEKQNCKRLKLPSMKQYVNAGMLVMNVKQIRKDNLTKKFIELSKRNYSSQDQDVLNIVCFGKILTLPPKYNAMVFRLIENSPLLRDLYKEEDIIEARESPYIIHYSDKNKPWNSIGIFKENNWWDIAKKIPYIDSLFNRENIYKEELKKIII